METIYLAWLLRDAPGAEYMRQARESGLTVGFVSATERKSIVEGLEGKVTGLERLRPLASGKESPGASAYGLISGPSLCCGQSCLFHDQLFLNGGAWFTCNGYERWHRVITLRILAGIRP
ncbi:hypothetical protein OG21DRAFT_1512313 [Imleria badia]|nr:hypothetical protein OG21DRAFT_1512313 [Imleria badia]